jgi:hypothetical protein
MHRVGIFAPEVEKKLRGYERFISTVLERCDDAGRPVSMYLCSDHGMTDVVDVFDVWGELKKKGYRLGRDFEAFFDSTMARFWRGERARRAAAEILSEAGAGRELTDGDLESFGCLFDDRAYGETICVANPGVMFVPSFMGRAKVAAMHGYDPDDAYSKGCFLTNDTDGDLPSSILDVKSYLEGRVRGGTA